VSLLTTATATAYENRAGSDLPLYALKRRKAQKQRGFRAKSTYGVESNIIRTCELRNKQARVFVRINRDAIFQE
jgi:hypothetical protein